MSTLQVDTINESTSASGVTIDGALIKDGKVTGGATGLTLLHSSTFSTVLQPSEAVETSSYNTTTTTVTAPYIPNQGVFRFSSSIDATAGEDRGTERRRR